MNKTRIAVSLLLFAAAATLGAAWYTGSRLETLLQRSVEQGNQQLQGAVPGLRIELQLLGMERGWFSSRARYGIKLIRPGGETRQLVVRDQIEHGPFPLQRLRAWRLWPVMAANRFQLEESAALHDWFAANGGRSPLSGSSSIDYAGRVAGQLQLLPLQATVDGQTVDFGGLDAQFTSDAQAQTRQFAGRMEHLELDIQAPYAARVALHGVTLLSDRQLSASGLYLGDSRVALERLSIAAPDQPLMEFVNLVQTDRLHEDEGRVAGNFTCELEMFSLNRVAVGSSRMAWDVQRLDASALKVLGELYHAYLAGVRDDAAASLNRAQQARLEEAFERVLAARPTLALSELVFRSANGESHASLQLALAEPAAFDLPLRQLLDQLIASLAVQIQVAKPMISDLILLQAAVSAEPARDGLAGEVAAAAELSGEIAVATGLGRVEGERIVADLDYRNGQVVLNGQSMPLEQLLGLLGALGQMLGAGALPHMPAPK